MVEYVPHFHTTLRDKPQPTGRAVSVAKRRDLARKQVKLMSRFERLGEAAARRATAGMRMQVFAAMKQGRLPDIRGKLIHDIAPTLSRMMVAAHLTGRKPLYQKQAGLKTSQKNNDIGPVVFSLDDAPNLTPFDNIIDAITRASDVQYINQLQKLYNTRALRVMNNVADDTEAELRQTINELVQQGVHGAEAGKALREKFDNLGLSDVKDYQLNTIFRTQAQLAFGAGRWQADQDPDIQEILWGYQYTAVMDDRTREEHAALDGTILPKDDGFWLRFWPPNGYNCRCQAIPIFAEEDAKQPPETDEDGEPITPDEGFDFNPGVVYSAGFGLSLDTMKRYIDTWNGRFRRPVYSTHKV